VEIDLAPGAGKATRKRMFELIAGHPALDLVNTLDWRYRETGPEELIASYDDLLRFTAQCGLISSAEARRLLRNITGNKGAHMIAETRALRESAASVFYAVVDENDPPTDAIRELESRFKEAEAHRCLRWSQSRLQWEFPATAPASELPLWILSLKTAQLLTSANIGMIRACGNPECRWLFLDTSKNHTRRWCEMKICGNRMKARRFKAQHRV
jgi:predicted RNA-binding Zn ribbon-like protein